MQKHYIGVDISKDTLAVAYFTSDNSRIYTEYKNTKKGIGHLIKMARKLTNAHIVLEDTGSYGKRLLHTLFTAGIPCSMLTSSQSKGFRDALKSLNKTDPGDAAALAVYGERMQPPTYELPLPEQEQMSQIRTYIKGLQIDKNRIENKLHALEHEMTKNKFVIKKLKESLDACKKNIDEAMNQLTDLQSEQNKEAIKNAESVVGIGPKTALFLVAMTDGFKNFDDAKKVAKFFGLCPTTFESGTSVRKRSRISKKGNGYIRALLYMCARSAKQHNQACKELYERLRAKGKPHKLAMVAVAHKLLRQVFAVVKEQKTFDRNFYANIQKNANLA